MQLPSPLGPNPSLPSPETVNVYDAVFRNLIITGTAVIPVVGGIGDPAGVLDSGKLVTDYLATLNGPGIILLGAGTFKFITSVVFTKPGQYLQCSGKKNTIISYQPTGAGTLFKWDAGSGPGAMYGCGIFGGCTITSPNVTVRKVALDFVDVGEMRCENVDIGPIGSWTGASSVGILTHGREVSLIQGCTIGADIPRQVSINPYLAGADLDHFDEKLMAYAPAAGNPSILIDTRCQVTNCTWQQIAMSLGLDGVRWVSTTSIAVPYNNRFVDVRREQGIGAGGWTVNIDINAGIQQTTIQNALSSGPGGGYRFRNAYGVKLDTVSHVGATVALDVDNTCDNIDGIATFFIAGSSVSLGGMRKTWSPVDSDSGSRPLPSTFHLDPTGNAHKWSDFFDTQDSAGYGSLIASGTVTLDTFNGNQKAGTLFVSVFGATTANGGVYAIDGTRCVAISQTAGMATPNTGAKFSIQNSGGTFILINNLAETVKYHWRVVWSNI